LEAKLSRIRELIDDRERIDQELNQLINGGPKGRPIGSKNKAKDKGAEQSLDPPHVTVP
jgi:hypothetical protein